MRHTAIIEAISFLLLILLVWLNELLDLPHHLLGAPVNGAPLRLEEALLETLVIVGVGVFVLLATGILSRRIREMESFIVICAWCRKVRVDQEWTSLEHFLAEHRSAVTHGICPDCEKGLEEGGH